MSVYSQDFPEYFTNLHILTGAFEYKAAWDHPDSLGHHLGSKARYFRFILTEDTEVSIDLSYGSLFVSEGTPQKGWASEPLDRYPVAGESAATTASWCTTASKPARTASPSGSLPESTRRKRRRNPPAAMNTRISPLP